MAWRLEFDARVAKDMARLGRAEQYRIERFLVERLQQAEKPRDLGKPLTGPYGGLWRYRVGDYRIICKIVDERLLILVVEVGHRRDIYR